jgi:peptidoglycan/LPS O-acetylase OafA/YrhL
VSQPAGHSAYLGRRYFPELDGVRALCVLLVITVHMYDGGRMWWWLAGMRGVTVFFVLSGYLITTLGLREEVRRGAVSLPAFYVRRCCRLLPLYYLTLAVYCLYIFVLGLAPALRQTLAEALPYYLFYLQEVPFYSWLIVAQRDVPFFHSWSLGVEEKFYLVWPVLAFVVWRGTAVRRRAACVALWAMFASAPFVLPLFDPSLKILGRCLFAYSHILAGCVLALLLDDRRWFARLAFLGRGGWTAAALALFLAVHFATPFVPEPRPSGYAWHALYAVASAVLLTSVLLGEGPLQRVLRIPPLVFVGKLSYGIYLLHVLAMIAAYRILPAVSNSVAAGLIAYGTTCAVAVAAAWGMSVVVERNGIAVGRRWSDWLLRRDGLRRPPVADPVRV